MCCLMLAPCMLLLSPIVLILLSLTALYDVVDDMVLPC